MMRRSALFAALLLAVAAASPAPLLAASARTYGTLTAAAGHDKTTSWYEANRAKVFAAANCHVLQDLGGGQYYVQTNTRAGACKYVIRETREERTTAGGKPMTIYRVKYVRNVSGRLADFELTIAMTGQAEGKTEVGMWIYANVPGRFIPVSAVTTVLEGSKSGVTSYIVKNAR
jgi:hypothetical protein